MGKYGDAAVQATNLIRRGGYYPCDAWEIATKGQFPTQKSAQKKRLSACSIPRFVRGRRSLWRDSGKLYAIWVWTEQTGCPWSGSIALFRPISCI